MRHSKTQTDIVTLWTETALMTVEAQMIIAMRLGGMAGFWNVTKAENNLMSTEKLAAAQAVVSRKWWTFSGAVLRAV